MLLLTAAAAAALASALVAAQAQERDRSEQAPAAGAVQPRAVKTESIRPAAPSSQANPGASTDSRATETTAADRPNVQQPSTPRRTVRTQRQRVAARHQPRPAQQRTLRTRRAITTGQATARISSVDQPSRSRAQYAQAVYVERGPAGPGDRIALTEPVVTSLNAAFADYIARMNVWRRAPWEFSATVGATVPGWVQVYGVPTEIVAVYPEFAGNEFVVVGDDVVVLEPSSRRIVAMISRTSNTAVAMVYAPPSTTGASTTGLAPLPEERIRLTRAQIATIRTVLRDRACRYERPADFFIGSLMPATAPVCAFPARVVSAVPDIGDYRYITRRNAVVVVDPGNDRVVTVLR
jgi:hypothetical protein